MSQADTEEPAYDLLLQDGAFALRRYAPKIVAEVEVSGDQSSASNRGFRPLADYIFGNNTISEDIAMTAPVTQKNTTKIAMTAPVTQRAKNRETWIIAFVMPSEWTMETLPKPNNQNIKLREIPSELMATIQFNGRGRGKKEARKRAELESWIINQGYEITGEAIGAYYNPPWILPAFRRNEVMIPVQPVG